MLLPARLCSSLIRSLCCFRLFPHFSSHPSTPHSPSSLWQFCFLILWENGNKQKRTSQAPVTSANLYNYMYSGFSSAVRELPFPLHGQNISSPPTLLGDITSSSPSSPVVPCYLIIPPNTKIFPHFPRKHLIPLLFSASFCPSALLCSKTSQKSNLYSLWDPWNDHPYKFIEHCLSPEGFLRLLPHQYCRQKVINH